MATAPASLSSATAVAVERLYEAFSGYDLPAVTSYCSHCVSADEEAELHRYPLRELPPAVMRSFAADSLMTWGDLPEVKHLLPRLLELVALAAYDGFPDVETIVGVLTRGGWATWPDVERVAVRGFLSAWWTDELATWPSHYDTASALSAIAVAEDDLAPYLAAWRAAADPAASLHFADLVAADATNLTAGGSLGNPWLVARRAQNAQATAWVRENVLEFRPRLEAIADLYASGNDHAYDVITTALIVAAA